MKSSAYRIRFIHIIYFLIIIALIIVSAIFIKLLDNKVNNEYLIYGKNDYLELKNGYIILLSDIDVINSGEIMINEDIDNIKSYTLTIYIYYKGKEVILLTKSQIIKSGEISTKISPNSLGERRIKGLYIDDDLSILYNNLYLSFEYIDEYDNTFENILKLYVIGT